LKILQNRLDSYSSIKQGWGSVVIELKQEIEKLPVVKNEDD
jgi:hypothetical protein